MDRTTKDRPIVNSRIPSSVPYVSIRCPSRSKKWHSSRLEREADALVPGANPPSPAMRTVSGSETAAIHDQEGVRPEVLDDVDLTRALSRRQARRPMMCSGRIPR